jgi:lysozyme
MIGSRGRLLQGAVTALLAVMVLAALLYQQGAWQLSNPDIRRYPVRGIDVSHHQGPIDWAKLPGQRVRFVYLKASEGGDWTDPLFARNLSTAPAKGIALGAYHYFTLCAPGRMQATNFLHAVPPYAPLTLPPAVDVEYVGNCAARPPRARFAHELLIFLDLVRTRFHTEPVLYSTQSFFDDYLSGPEFAGHPLWVRSLIGEAQWSKGRRVLFRQFADHARYDGVAGPVDVDLFNGTEAEFAALVR